jgi:pimeloyl-ACP methyl ester carboxylesterase
VQIQRYRIAVSDADILDLRHRLELTRWPSSTEGSGWELGIDLDFLKSLVTYWRTQFDWRAIEAELNTIPQFEALSQSGSIHFARLEAARPGALPILLTHGWPSSFAEFLTLGDMLASPEKYGAKSADAFDVVIPSLPGYVFSSPPRQTGTHVFRIAELWADLMTALGYDRFIAHGGDLGAGVSTALALRHPQRLLGVHLNFIPGSYRPAVHDSALCAEEIDFFERRAAWLDAEGGYSHVQGTKPDVLGVSLNDSPAGLAAWVVDKFRSWSDCNGDVGSRFTHDELLTTISLYWFTRSMPSAIRLYWEGRKHPLHFAAGERVNVPVGIAHFPRELPMPPRRYVERGYNVTRWTLMPKGGHFAAIEEPAALAEDIRAFARPLRSG